MKGNATFARSFREKPTPGGTAMTGTSEAAASAPAARTVSATG